MSIANVRWQGQRSRSSYLLRSKVISKSNIRGQVSLTIGGGLLVKYKSECNVYCIVEMTKSMVIKRESQIKCNIRGGGGGYLL